MKTALPISGKPLALITSLAVSPFLHQTARADVTWEHSGSVRMGNSKNALVKFKSFTNVTPQRMRLLFKYDATASLGALPGSMPSGFPGIGGPMGASMPMETFAPLKNGAPINKQMHPSADEMPANPLVGSVTVVQRFDDQKFLSYSSFTKDYMEETFKDLLDKSRFDPWRKLAPKLSKETPPAFTPEQRTRLGAEVRAVLSPFTKMLMKTYFRALPEKRTFNGIEGQGYRYTTLFNVEPSLMGAGKWARFSAEWWVAGDLPGDDVFGQLHEAALKTVGRDVKSSTSMWMNETPRVMWEMLPEEFHMATSTMFPRPDTPDDSPEWKRSHMPLYGAITIEPPAGMAGKDEVLHIETKLVRRSVESLPEHIWNAPIGYKRKPIEDVNKAFDQIMKAMPPMPFPGGPNM